MTTDDLIVALRAVEARIRLDAWHPIETAPKDGTCFRVWIATLSGGFHISPCRYTNAVLEHYNARVFDWFTCSSEGVTHWAPIVQPLPPPMAGLAATEKKRADDVEARAEQAEALVAELRQRIADDAREIADMQKDRDDYMAEFAQANHAMVAAAYRDAADVAFSYSASNNYFVSAACAEVAKGILTKTPADSQAALDRITIEVGGERRSPSIRPPPPSRLTAGTHPMPTEIRSKRR